MQTSPDKFSWSFSRRETSVQADDEVHLSSISQNGSNVAQNLLPNCQNQLLSNHQQIEKETRDIDFDDKARRQTKEVDNELSKMIISSDNEKISEKENQKIGHRQIDENIDFQNGHQQNKTSQKLSQKRYEQNVNSQKLNYRQFLEAERPHDSQYSNSEGLSSRGNDITIGDGGDAPLSMPEKQTTRKELEESSEQSLKVKNKREEKDNDRNQNKFSTNEKDGKDIFDDGNKIDKSRKNDRREMNSYQQEQIRTKRPDSKHSKECDREVNYDSDQSSRSERSSRSRRNSGSSSRSQSSQPQSDTNHDPSMTHNKSYSTEKRSVLTISKEDLNKNQSNRNSEIVGKATVISVEIDDRGNVERNSQRDKETELHEERPDINSQRSRKDTDLEARPSEYKNSRSGSQGQGQRSNMQASRDLRVQEHPKSRPDLNVGAPVPLHSSSPARGNVTMAIGQVSTLSSFLFSFFQCLSLPRIISGLFGGSQPNLVLTS